MTPVKLAMTILALSALESLSGPVAAEPDCRQIAGPVAQASSEATRQWQVQRGIGLTPSVTAAIQTEIGAAIAKNCGREKATPVKSAVVYEALTNYLDAMIDMPTKTASFAAYLRQAEHYNAAMLGGDRPFALLKVRLDPTDSDLFLNEDPMRISKDGAYLVSPGRVRVRGAKAGYTDCNVETQAPVSKTTDVTCSLAVAAAPASAPPVDPPPP